MAGLWPPPCLWYWWWWPPSWQSSPHDCPEGQETDSSDSLQRFHGVREAWKRTSDVNDGGDPRCFIAFGMTIVVDENRMMCSVEKSDCIFNDHLKWMIYDFMWLYKTWQNLKIGYSLQNIFKDVSYRIIYKAWIILVQRCFEFMRFFWWYFLGKGLFLFFFYWNEKKWCRQAYKDLSS